MLEEKVYTCVKREKYVKNRERERERERFMVSVY